MTETEEDGHRPVSLVEYFKWKSRIPTKLPNGFNIARAKMPSISLKKLEGFRHTGYTVSNQTAKVVEPHIKLISPATQSVDQARETIKRDLQRMDSQEGINNTNNYHKRQKRFNLHTVKDPSRLRYKKYK